MNANDIKIAEWAKARTLPDGTHDTSRVLAGCIALGFDAVDVATHSNGVSMFHARVKDTDGLRWKRIDIDLDGYAKHYLQTHPGEKKPAQVTEPQIDAILTPRTTSAAIRDLMASMASGAAAVPAVTGPDAELVELSEDGFPVTWLADELGTPEAVAEENTSPLDVAP